MKVLLLNFGESGILSLIEWQRAVCLFLDGKAVKPYNHEDYYDIRTVSGVFRLPTALVLGSYIRVPRRMVAVNKANVLRRDGFICQYCGKALTSNSGTVDHIIPVSRGGRHVWDNVACACIRCNNKKDSLTAVEFENKYGKKLRCNPYAPTRDLLMLSSYDIRNKREWDRWVVA